MSVRINFLAEAKPAQAGEAASCSRRGPRSARERRVLRLGRHRGPAAPQAPSQVGDEMGDRIVIRAGLLGGEALVVGDAEGLADGRKVVAAES